MQCQANLSQVGKAVQDYHDRYSHYPGVTIPNFYSDEFEQPVFYRRLPPEKGFAGNQNLFHVLLPYLEQGNIAQMWPPPSNKAIKLYQCPAAGATFGTDYAVVVGQAISANCPLEGTPQGPCDPEQQDFFTLHDGFGGVRAASARAWAESSPG